MKCDKCGNKQTVAFCNKCQHNICLKCLKDDLIQNKHNKQVYYCCQQCQQQKASKFCYSCDQHLCSSCNSRIHNKGKRAQHTVQQINTHSNFQAVYIIVILADSKLYFQDSNQLFLTLCQKLPFQSQNQLTPQNIHLLIQGSAMFEVNLFSYTTITAQQLTDQFFIQYCKYYPVMDKLVFFDSIQSRKLKQKIINSELLFLSNVAQVQSRNNLSTSTDNNESISKTNTNSNISIGGINAKKPPISYFQFYKLSKDDRRSQIQLKMRKLAAQGILILKRKQITPVEGVIRSFVRTVGQIEIQYCSLQISYISIQSLVWVIRSIKQDLMTPGQKLILSRIKQSFDIKLHSKFWQSILNYIGSPKYQNEYDKGLFGFSLPKIILSKHNDQTILLLKNQQWKFEDQQKLDQQSQTWKDFSKFLLEYFQKNKNIPGGRYGCVQFVKIFGPQPLNLCSLGKLSLYVQQAINKGLIRYHKTLLIKNVIEDPKSFTESGSFHEGQYSFSFHEKSLYLLQKQLKIKTLQSSLTNILLQNLLEVQHKQNSISLAQIPLFLKKTISFNFNLPELGFPKLKNLILTLSDIFKIQINKSALSYSLYYNTQVLISHEKEKLSQLAEQFLNTIKDIIDKIVKYFNIIVVQDLYNQINTKIGFQLDFRIFNAPDFCHFLYYYCNDRIHIQFVSGVFMAYSKQSNQQSYNGNIKSMYYKQNPETSTPNFCNSFDSGVKVSYNKFPDVFYFTNQLQQKKQESSNMPESQQILSNLKFVEYLLNDQQDDRSHTTYKTVIENENIVNNLDWSISNLITAQQISIINTNNKNTHIKALSQDFDIQKKNSMTKHGRFLSTIQHKKNQE